MLSYILAGVVALDIIWIHRSSIIDVLSNLLVYWPLGENAKYRSLFTLDIGKLKYYRLKFTILLVLSYGLALLLVVYYFWLGYIIVRAYTDSDPEGKISISFRNAPKKTFYTRFHALVAVRH